MSHDLPTIYKYFELVRQVMNNGVTGRILLHLSLDFNELLFSKKKVLLEKENNRKLLNHKHT